MQRAPAAEKVLVALRVFKGKVEDTFKDVDDVGERQHDEGWLRGLEDVVTKSAANAVDVGIAVLTKN